MWRGRERDMIRKVDELENALHNIQILYETEKEEKDKKMNGGKWKCEQCGKCCKFIVIPVAETISGETMEYLEAHGIAVAGNKLLIPARCEHLKATGFGDYECAIHATKFKNCKAGGEKECKNAQEDYKCLRNLKS